MSRVVVLGAAGRTGQLVVDRALEGGHVVTAAVRHPERLAPLVQRWSASGRFMAVAGDITDLDQMQAAVAGQDAVLVAVGPAGRDPHGLFSTTARTLVPAMQAEQVTRLLCLSSRGVARHDRNLPLLYRAVIRPLLLRRTYADLTVMEDAFRASDLAWTMVRTGRLTDQPGRGSYRIGDGHNPPRRLDPRPARPGRLHGRPNQ